MKHSHILLVIKWTNFTWISLTELHSSICAQNTPQKYIKETSCELISYMHKDMLIFISLQKVSRKWMVRQPGHCSSMPFDFFTAPSIVSPHFPYVPHFCSCFFLVRSLESITWETNSAFAVFKAFLLVSEELQNTGHQHFSRFPSEKGLTTGSQSGRREEGTDFVNRISLTLKRNEL